MYDEHTQKEIKPCPFCKSINVMILGTGFFWMNYKVKCFGCKASGPSSEAREMAIILWNEAERKE